MKEVIRIVRRALHFYSGDNPLKYLIEWYARKGYLVLSHDFHEGGFRENYSESVDKSLSLSVLYLGKRQVYDKNLTDMILKAHNDAASAIILLKAKNQRR